MQASNAPTKSAVPFANSGTKNTIPVASQIGITPGLASFTDGFPPLTMTPLAAGGVPPYGADFNGILNFLSASTRWGQAGAGYTYDATFSTAIGGYPKGAMLLKSDQSGYWVSTADNNTSNPDTGGASWRDPFSAVSIAHGQCRLAVVSATSLRLSPYNGTGLIINGVQAQVPSAGVTITNSGLTANTLYFVYAYLNASSVVTLEISTVSHSTATNGVETKTGDVSRTLVGMIYTSATSQFVDSTTDRLCLNWFNRRSISAGQVLSSFTTFTNTTINEINSALRARFLAWKDEAVFGCVDGYGSNNTVGNNVQVQTFIDATAFGAALVLTSSTATASGAFSSSGTGFFDDGLHTVQLYGFVNGSQGTLGIGCYAKVLTRG